MEEALAIKQETERITAHITQLASFLEIVGAREQLEEVQKAWKVGTIDTTPEPSILWHTGDSAFRAEPFIYAKHPHSEYQLCMALSFKV